MSNFSYLHDQWLYLSLGGGLVLVLLIVLSYLAVWRPRHPEADKRPVPASGSVLRFFPWVLAVIYLAIFVYYFISPFLWIEGPK
jgi:heme A synthase